MSEKTQITNPIEIKDNSTERVAFDLMEKIAYAESKRENGEFLKPNSREYYFKLYNQCLKVTSWSGIDIKDIL